MLNISLLSPLLLYVFYSCTLYSQYDNQRAYWARNVACNSLGDRTVVSGRSDQ